jgi:hypothetical protein
MLGSQSDSNSNCRGPHKAYVWGWGVAIAALTAILVWKLT